MKRDPLPRPTIDVTPSSDGLGSDVVISRDGKEKKYKGEGSTREGVVKDVVKKILDDPHSAEWLP